MSAPRIACLLGPRAWRSATALGGPALHRQQFRSQTQSGGPHRTFPPARPPPAEWGPAQPSVQLLLRVPSVLVSRCPHVLGSLCPGTCRQPFPGVGRKPRRVVTAASQGKDWSAGPLPLRVTSSVPHTGQSPSCTEQQPLLKSDRQSLGLRVEQTHSNPDLRHTSECPPHTHTVLSWPDHTPRPWTGALLGPPRVPASPGSLVLRGVRCAHPRLG